MVPFFTSETAFHQNVGDLVLGINVFDLDSGGQLDFVNLPIERKSVERHVSHRRTSALKIILITHRCPQ